VLQTTMSGTFSFKPSSASHLNNHVLHHIQLHQALGAAELQQAAVVCLKPQ
jgi:hypothetical protein